MSVVRVNSIGAARRQALGLSRRAVEQNRVEEGALPHSVGMFTCTLQDHASAVAPEGRCLEPPYNAHEVIVLEKKYRSPCSGDHSVRTSGRGCAEAAF